MAKFGKDYFYGKAESNYSNYGKINHSKHFRRVVAIIKDMEIKGRFLDAGCAFGFLLKEVSPFFSELYGCDISGFAVKKAKAKMPMANIKVVNIMKDLPYNDSHFDCIAALDVIEHTENIEVSLANITKKLKRGGHLILSLPINSWPRKLFGSLDKDKTHISVPTEEHLIDVVRKTGLEIISKKKYCPTPGAYKIPGIPAEIELVLRK